VQVVFKIKLPNMKVNIITHCQECVEFLSFFSPSKDCELHVEYVHPYELIDGPDFTNNKFGWTSWLKMKSFLFLKTVNYSREDLTDESIKYNVYNVEKFIKENKAITFEKLQSLFFFKESNGYEIEKLEDTIRRRNELKINEKCFGISLEFLYSEDIEQDELLVPENYVEDSYKQLITFYNSFVTKYSPSLLFLLPHFDPDVRSEIDILEGRYYPDDYSPFDDHDHEDGWAEEGRQEERKMDEETNGDWRWNID